MSGNNGTGHRLEIAELRMKNFKCIRRVELVPEGGVIRIAGRPGQGKTSILEAIEAAFRGGDETLVRRGADHAEIFLAAGDLVIDRTIDRDGKQRLAVTSGGRPLATKAATALLGEICGEHVFRPIRWVQLSGGDPRGRTERLRKQRDELLHAIPLHLSKQELVDAVRDLGEEALRILGSVRVDPNLEQQHGLVACEALYKICYDTRSDANREQEIVEAKIKALPIPPLSYPPEPAAQLLERERIAERAWQQALGAHEAQASTRSRATALRTKIGAAEAAPVPDSSEEERIIAAGLQVKEQSSRLQAEIEELQAKIALLRRDQDALEVQREQLRKDLNTAREGADAARRRVAELERDRRELAELERSLGQALANPGVLRQQVEQIRAARQLREQVEQYNAVAQAVDVAAARSKTLSQLVELFQESLPARLLGRARFPVPGLGLDGEQLTINGVPIHRLGTADQIRLGFAVAIALNPQAGFVCVDGAESLGVEGRQALAAAAQEAGVQLWMSEVSENPEPGSIVMQAGEAVGVVGHADQA